MVCQSPVRPPSGARDDDDQGTRDDDVIEPYASPPSAASLVDMTFDEDEADRLSVGGAAAADLADDSDNDSMF